MPQHCVPQFVQELSKQHHPDKPGGSAERFEALRHAKKHADHHYSPRASYVGGRGGWWPVWRGQAAEAVERADVAWSARPGLITWESESETHQTK